MKDEKQQLIEELEEAKEQFERNPRLMVEFDGENERKFQVLPSCIT